MDMLLMVGEIRAGAMPPLLSLMIGLPLLGALMLLFLPKEQESMIRGLSLATSLATACVGFVILAVFRENYHAYQLTESYEWIPQLGAKYLLGLDGVSLWFSLLTVVMVPIAMLSSFKHLSRHHKGFFLSLLFLESAALCAFAALDTLLFYFSWEAMLIPMFLLIGIWGGQQRTFATLKFVLYSVFGSLLMFAALLYLYFQTGTVSDDAQYSFSLAAMLNTDLSVKEQLWLFLAFGLAFATRLPLSPLHTWLPDAQAQAPTGASVLLGSVFLGMGGYGLVRFALPLFPVAAVRLAPYVGIFCVVGILYAALVALAQKDTKRLIAYASVSQMGFVVLGVFALNPQGVEGGIFHLLAHGVSTAGLFLCIGILYEQRKSLLIKDYGGLAKQVPRLSFIFAIFLLSSAGLPGLSGFVGEFLILAGTFGSAVFSKGWGAVLALFAGLGILLSGGLFVWMLRRMLFGTLSEKNKDLKDIGVREGLYLAPILLLIFVMGLYPELFLKHIRPSSQEFFRTFNQRLELSQAREESLSRQHRGKLQGR